MRLNLIDCNKAGQATHARCHFMAKAFDCLTKRQIVEMLEDHGSKFDDREYFLRSRTKDQIASFAASCFVG